MLKGAGYLVSTLSVILLGITAWKSASEQPLMAACLILGSLTSVGGMVLRWLSFRADEKPAKPESPAEMVRDARRRAGGHAAAQAKAR